MPRLLRTCYEPSVEATRRALPVLYTVQLDCTRLYSETQIRVRYLQVCWSEVLNPRFLQRNQLSHKRLNKHCQLQLYNKYEQDLEEIHMALLSVVCADDSVFRAPALKLDPNKWRLMAA